MNDSLFSDFDFSSLDSPNFKEDSVREDLIMPLLKELGYSSQSENKIIRSKSVRHKFVQTGSGKHKLNSVPDYLLEVGGKYAWVLDAKAPNEDIKTGKNVEQTYFYAIHPEIRVQIYAVCNGREFIAFDIHGDTLIYFALSEIEKYWQKLQDLLSPQAFDKTQKRIEEKKNEVEFDYLSRKPLDELKKVRKRGARRHFGVHGYFTKQSWDVVQSYIRNFTKPNDVVLDPFGGSGITAVEAVMINRKGIHIDINPLSVFLVKSLLIPTDLQKLQESFEDIKDEYLKNFPKTTEEYSEFLTKYSYPKGNILPKGSDVETVEHLFSQRQLSQLAYLRHLIRKVKSPDIRNTLLLIFSTTITKINRTYHHSTYAGENAGDCSAFRYYRFRIAPEEVNLDTFLTFEGKFKNIIAAKKEIAPVINQQTVQNAQIYKGTATNLDKIEDESVDYIYTDPPYGKKIPYLDLSIMWNAWLDLEVSEKDYQLEAIEGGEHHKTKKDYSNLLAESIREMYRVLKFDRWMSFVFAHKDPEYWHLIVDTAEKIGFEYAGAVKQNNGQTSFKKRQNPFTVLSGQLIINFKKVRNPKSIMKADLGADITDLIIQSIEGVIAKNTGATLEEINDELIIRGLELGFLDVLSKKYQDITPFLLANFDYDKETENYLLKRNTKFRSQIPIELRIRFYLESMLRRFAREGKPTHFSDIILEIMPLLKNGVTPDNQTILSVLENIADKVGEDSWRLKESGQRNLFNLI
jgi:16S rRNA G966 N2-methylase RsmD